MKSLLNDPRDVPHLKLYLQCSLLFIPSALLLFAWKDFPWYLGVAYIVMWLSFGDRFTMSYHCTLHRRLFKPKHWVPETYLTWILCPFFGQTPNTFHIHHMAMHHVDENLPRDLSSTMAYRRDSFVDFLRYYLRFACLIMVELSAYLTRAGNRKLMARLLAGEAAFIAVTILAALWNLKATLVVIIFPFVFVRLMMMVGNWVQHAFIDPDHPDDPYRSSVNTITADYNKRVFNAGYHIYHHVRKGTHYTELSTEFAQNREKYGKKDAVVFDGLELPGIWFLLMTKQHRKLARSFVRLPGAPTRTEDDVVALLERRLSAIRDWTPTPLSLASRAA